MSTFRVLTFNIHKGLAPLSQRLVIDQVRQAIRLTEADLVFLQEVVGINDNHAKQFADWPEQAHYEFLADQMWPQYAYGQNAIYPAGHHGNAILSKYPIRAFEQRNISASRLEQRGILYAQVDVPETDTIIHCINVHFGLRERWRMQQLELLSDFINARIPGDAPLIVAGDFNDWSRRVHQRFVDICGVIEAYWAKHGRLARTFPCRFPVFSLDRIYVRNIEPISAAQFSDGMWSVLSDHVGLSAELRLRNTRS